jgi:hypothetical protein
MRWRKTPDRDYKRRLVKNATRRENGCKQRLDGASSGLAEADARLLTSEVLYQLSYVGLEPRD